MFEHVSDARLRRILTDDLIDEDSVCYAITTTREAVEADSGNEDVSFEVLSAREESLGVAEAEWNDEGRADKAMAALRRCWSI